MKFNYFLSVICLSIFISASAQFQNTKDLPFTWKTDTLQHSVKLSEIQIVLPKHSFPTLDAPDFVDKTEGLDMFFKNEPVIVVKLDGQAKAYPLNILTMHEIANDILGDHHILATYCPLCNSGIVYNRKIIIKLISEKGIILNVSSKMGSLDVCKLTDSVAYRMSKSALNMYTKILTNRLKDKIKVASIHPGWVKTTIIKSNIKNGRLTPKESAENIFEFINNDFKSGAFWNSENGTELLW